MKKFAFVLLLAAACGKRGDPHPPVPVIPKATSDLVVAQRGSRLILSWSYPSLTTAGQSLPSVRRVVLYRFVEEGFAKTPPIGPMQFAKVRTRLDSLEGTTLPAASAGARLTYEDTPAFKTADGQPVRISYAVQTQGNTATSDLSNLAVIVPMDVPTPPTALTAAAKPEGVVLTWQAPATTISGAKNPTIGGYNVYRLASGESEDDAASPVNTTPVSRAGYTDVPPYGTFTYFVRAVSGPSIESEPSPTASATFKDLLPPPTPTGLAALVETKAVRLVWDPVDAPDLAGYMVYRSEGSGVPLTTVSKPIPLTTAPITAANFRDTGTDPGISYFYEVTAVDKSGNASARAKTDWVLVPKTP